MSLTKAQTLAVASAWGWDELVPYRRLFIDFATGMESWEEGTEPNPEGAAAFVARKLVGLVASVGQETADALLAAQAAGG